MGRRGESCGRCGARRHGKRRHVTGSAAMAPCARCQTAICSDHATWDADAGESGQGAWVCKTASLCQRDQRRG